MTMLNKCKSVALLLLMATLALIIRVPAFPQESIFYNYREEEGLPSNEVYDMLESPDGYLWFATENGVCMYDGTNFRNFNKADGLAATSVVKIYQDLFGRTWFLSYNGTLSYYENGIIRPYEHNDTVVKYYIDNYIGKITIDSNYNILLSPRQGGMGLIDSRGGLSDATDLVPRQADSCYLYFREIGNDHFITILSAIPEGCNNNGRLYYCDGASYLRVKYSCKEFHRNFIKTGNGKYIVSYRNVVYVIEDMQVQNIKVFSEEVLSLYLDNEGEVWISVKYDNGVFIFEDASLQGEPRHMLDGYTITSVMQDREGYFWLSSEGNGVFFAESFEYKVYTLPGLKRNIKVMSMDIYKDRLWFTTREREIYSGKISNGSIDHVRKLNIEDPIDWIKHIVVDRNGYLWLSATKQLRYDPAGFAAPPDTTGNFSYIGKGKGDTIIVANKRLGFYKDSKLIDLFFPAIERRI
ncbi:MAG TPA: two-component regulator propeller domain-containing protein, partial [Bacteroidales bacterium]|nr:two-component regulator propeller domain-containing protein [Bacteroidales bacterium]